MKPSQARNLYEILDIDRRASTAEIDDAFRKQAFLWHPDKHVDDYENADAEFKILMNAYCILSDPTRRRDYDRYHFKKPINPNYGHFHDERLAAYRAKQKSKVLLLLEKSQSSLRRCQFLSRLSLAAMIVAAGLLIACAVIDGRSGDTGLAGRAWLAWGPLLLFNGGLFGFVIARKEAAELRRRIRGLVIKLYSLVDER